MNLQAVLKRVPEIDIVDPLKLCVCHWSQWLFIVFVSVWDGFLTFIYRSHMQFAELNPMGRLLIDFNSGGVTYLLGAKTLGTIIVTSLLATIYHLYPRKALVITTPIACLQLALLLFLTFR